MLPAKRDKNLYLAKLTNTLFNTDENEEVDLIISLENTNVSLRDFSAFLLLIDHFFGRTYRKGFLSYSLTEDVHLRAAEIRSGSIEIIIEQIIKYLPVSQAIYFYLLIKYLPSALKSLSESFLNTSDALYTFEKTRLVRRMRKDLRKELKDDEILESLSDEEIKKLAAELQKKYELERKHLFKGARFANEKMKFVKVQKRKL